MFMAVYLNGLASLATKERGWVSLPPPQTSQVEYYPPTTPASSYPYLNGLATEERGRVFPLPLTCHGLVGPEVVAREGVIIVGGRAGVVVLPSRINEKI
jgi:hypothetical protein